MITKEQLLKIRGYIACPQFGDKSYGKWGALRLEQREAFLQLIETVEFLEDKIKTQQAEIERLQNHIKNTFENLTKQCVEHEIKTVKSEAYREFAEKVKEKLVYGGVNAVYGLFKWNNITTYDIDNTLNELTEVKINEQKG